MEASKPHRILIVATEHVVAGGLHDVLQRHLRAGANEAFVVAPAVTESRFQQAAGEIDDAQVDARQRLEESLEALRGENLAIGGAVGDSDPMLAIEDGLRQFEADEILIVTKPDDEARWMEDDLFDRAKVEFEQEVTHVAVEHEGAHEHVVETEHSGPGREAREEDEVEGQSRNTPRFSVRDLAGIAVAVIGSVILVIIAGTCEGEDVQRDAGTGGEGSDAACVAVYIIAGAAVLINLAHVVAMLLFESVRYRGFWERFFSRMSLFGTPAAIVAALIIRSLA